MLQKKKSKSNDNDNEILKIHQGVPEIHTYIFPMILHCKNNYRTYMIKETKKKKEAPLLNSPIGCPTHKEHKPAPLKKKKKTERIPLTYKYLLPTLK